MQLWCHVIIHFIEFFFLFFSLEVAGKDECEEAVFNVKILLETKIRY